MGPISSVVLMLSSDAGYLTNPHSYFAVAGEQAGQGSEGGGRRGPSWIKAAVRV